MKLLLSIRLAYGASTQLPPGVVSIPVPGAPAAYILPAEKSTGRVIIYLHGHCGDPLAGLRSFPKAAQRVGTMISVQGDLPCKGRPGRRRWSTDAVRIETAIHRALSAASDILDQKLVSSERVLVGYSEGALRAELLSGTFPGRYPRIILGGEPRAPRPENFRQARSVVTLAGQLDLQAPMRDGADTLARAGIPARFFLLPGARHGQYGPDWERVLGEAFSWLLASSPDPSP
ncbi:MAG: hypothetical protein RMJ98_12060 [Myxococcales bacterium]|nr:hypothetical protein [Polyangiaceae bacterium]MDW8250021.1 hypothetical protein [Myxococcales bacterium]